MIKRLGVLRRRRLWEIVPGAVIAAAAVWAILIYSAGGGAQSSPNAPMPDVGDGTTGGTAAIVDAASRVSKPRMWVTQEQAQAKGCLSCHEGIEDINPKMVEAGVTCTTCHRGNPLGSNDQEAHQGMFANPSDLRVVEQTCGQCHDDKGSISQVVSAGERNHVPRVLRSLMATAAGEIASTRYLWGAQDSLLPLFGLRPVTALGAPSAAPSSPRTVPALAQLPPAATSDADNLLRNFCLRCHLWTRGDVQTGMHRAAGCAACHVLYDDSGLSSSGDPTIPKTTPGHPVKHEITVKVPTAQCLHCHNDGGGRIGLSYVGLMPTSGGGSPYQADGTHGMGKYGITTLAVRPDVHYEKGMECIDCHTSKEVHGDGQVYTRKEHEVRITCESCHGTPTTGATLTDNRGEALKNVRRDGSEVVVTGKVDGKRRYATQLDKLNQRGSLPLAMRIPAHLQEKGGRATVGCAACHARNTPQCYGCHLKRDDREMAAVDWGEGVGEGAKAQASVGVWSGETVYQRWEDPALGIDSQGRVAPFVPGGQVLFTRIGQRGEVLSLNKARQVTVEGRGKVAGFAMNPLSPHATTKQARTCESCHNSPKALGLGSEPLLTRGSGWDVDVPFDRMVDDQGNPLQITTHPGARPFNKVELGRINRETDCISCHKDMDNAALWKQVTDMTGLANTPRDHQDIISWIFKRGALNGQSISPSGVAPSPTPPWRP